MKVTGIGGGHGLAATLRAALDYATKIDAVVTVADDGGSSGRLTRELGVPPPGDIRNCLVALASNEELAELFQHRFSAGPLTGHTVGNLAIAALVERTGDFATAVETAGKLLGARGLVHPATTELVGLRANVRGGVIEGQVAVAQTDAPIESVELHPAEPAANPPAVDAILNADQVVLGPGSLFTSLIATLVVPGIAQALRQTSARRVFVCNTRMQKGETFGLTASAHARALLDHVGPSCIDSMIVQLPELPGEGIVVDDEGLDALGIAPTKADVAGISGAHDPALLARVLSEVG